MLALYKARDKQAHWHKYTLSRKLFFMFFDVWKKLLLKRYEWQIIIKKYFMYNKKDTSLQFDVGLPKVKVEIEIERTWIAIYWSPFGCIISWALALTTVLQLNGGLIFRNQTGIFKINFIPSKLANQIELKLYGSNQKWQ